ncbi:MAG: hypothetical protein ACP5OZ_04320 [Candidatus Woesearchaeota archaeon]
MFSIFRRKKSEEKIKSKVKAKRENNERMMKECVQRSYEKGS